MRYTANYDILERCIDGQLRVGKAGQQILAGQSSGVGVFCPFLCLLAVQRWTRGIKKSSRGVMSDLYSVKIGLG
jgi:hypothetical protein